MSMISPEMYIEFIKDKSYTNLIEEREKLIKEIRQYEKDSTDKYTLIMTNPAPEVRYQMNLKYLAELCKLISNVYRRDYIYGKMSDN